MMSHSEGIVAKGIELTDRICALCASYYSYEENLQKLELSFDVYCILVEYTSLINQYNKSQGYTTEELLNSDELIFETGQYQLPVVINFNAAVNTIMIR